MDSAEPLSKLLIRTINNRKDADALDAIHGADISQADAQAVLVAIDAGQCNVSSVVRRVFADIEAGDTVAEAASTAGLTLDHQDERTSD